MTSSKPTIGETNYPSTINKDSYLNDLISTPKGKKRGARQI